MQLIRKTIAFSYQDLFTVRDNDDCRSVCFSKIFMNFVLQTLKKKQYFNATIWSLNEKYVVMIWLIIMFQTIRRVEYCYYLGLFFGRICLIFFVQFHYWHQDLDIYSPKTETWINFYPIDRSEYLGLSLFRNLSTLHSRNKLQSRYQHDISSHI